MPIPYFVQMNLHCFKQLYNLELPPLGAHTECSYWGFGYPSKGRIDHVQMVAVEGKVDRLLGKKGFAGKTAGDQEYAI